MRALLLPLCAPLVCALGCAADPEFQGNPSTPDAGGFVTIPDSGTTTVCRGNRDGVITRGEVVFVPGVEVHYRINPVNTLANVAPGGVTNADGTRSWDFTDRSGDSVTLSLSTSQDQWWQARFPTAQYASALDPRSPNLGVYRAGDTSVELLGLIAPDESTMTVVPYDPGVPVLRFPLMMGATWTADTNTAQDAQVEGTTIYSRDQYTFTVDARGTVRLPELTFTDALRVRIELTQQLVTGGMRKIQYLWMVECYGEIARMTSREGEVDPDFRLAAEYRRLGL